MKHEPSEVELDVWYWQWRLSAYIAQSDEAAIGLLIAKRRLKEARARLRASREPKPIRKEPMRINPKWRKEEAS